MENHRKCLLLPSCSSLFGSQHVPVHVAIPFQGQDLRFPFVERHEVPVHIFLQLVQVSLNGSTPAKSIKHSSQFAIVCSLPEGTLPLLRSLMKMLNSICPSTDARDTGLCVADHNPAVYPVFSLAHCPLIWSVFHLCSSLLPVHVDH